MSFLNLLEETTTKRFSRATQVSFVGLIGLVLSGCGKDLSQEPFVMSCTGTNAFTMAHAVTGPNVPTHLSGIELPDEAELRKARPMRRGMFHEVGFLPHETPLKGNISAIPLANYPGPIYENTGKITSSVGFMRERTLYDPVGELRAAHYYITRAGDMHEINDFYIARFQSVEDGYLLRTAATLLPPDAAYAVIYLEAETQEQTKNGAQTEPGRKGEPGYWVLPLDDRYRYQPFSDDHRYGDIGVDRPLGPYVASRYYADDDTPNMGPHRGRRNPMAPHRRPNPDVETIPCMMALGFTTKFSYIYDVDAGENDDGYYPTKGRTPRGYNFIINDYYFVGGKEALEDLPQNPKKFKG